MIHHMGMKVCIVYMYTYSTKIQYISMKLCTVKIYTYITNIILFRPFVSRLVDRYVTILNAFCNWICVLCLKSTILVTNKTKFSIYCSCCCSSSDCQLSKENHTLNQKLVQGIPGIRHNLAAAGSVSCTTTSSLSSIPSKYEVTLQQLWSQHHQTT